MKSVIIFFMFVAQVHGFYLDILLNDLIHETCKQTPNYNLCVKTLESSLESSHADLKGLAEIMIGSLESRAALTLHHIRHMLRDVNMEYEKRKALRSCASHYKVILRGDVPQIIEPLERGDYKYAEQGTRDVAAEAHSCENAFSGKSLLARMNHLVHDISIVATSIVRTILNT